MGKGGAKKALQRMLNTSARMAGQAVSQIQPARQLAKATGIPLAENLGKLVDKRVASALKNAGGKSATYVGRGAYMVGRGSYQIDAPQGAIYNDTFVQSKKASNITSITQDGSNLIICGKEFVTKVVATGSSSYSCQGFAVNPGLRSVFPWLAQVAPNFQEYEAVQVAFEYQPVVSSTSVSAVGSLGNVILGVQYNAGAANYASYAAIASSDHSAAGNIATPIVCGIECQPSKMANNSKLYVRAGAVPAGQDIKTYDLAKLQVAMDGVPVAYTAGTQLGNLWIHYTIALSKKTFWDSAGYNISTDVFWGDTSCSASLPLGSSILVDADNSIGGRMGTVAVSSAQRYTFPDDFSGTVLINSLIVGTGLTAASLGTSGGGVTTQNGLMNATVSDTPQIKTIASDGDSVQISQMLNVTPAATAGANWVSLSATGTTFVAGFFRIQLANPLQASVVSTGIPQV